MTEERPAAEGGQESNGFSPYGSAYPASAIRRTARTKSNGLPSRAAAWTPPGGHPPPLGGPDLLFPLSRWPPVFMLAKGFEPRVYIFNLDTGYQFRETLADMGADRGEVRHRGRSAAAGLKHPEYEQRQAPLSPAIRTAAASTARSPCCTAWRCVDAWATGVRRDQGPTRADTPDVKWDQPPGEDQPLGMLDQATSGRGLCTRACRTTRCTTIRASAASPARGRCNRARSRRSHSKQSAKTSAHGKQLTQEKIATSTHEMATGVPLHFLGRPPFLVNAHNSLVNPGFRESLGANRLFPAEEPPRFQVAKLPFPPSYSITFVIITRSPKALCVYHPLASSAEEFYPVVPVASDSSAAKISSG